jgi:hypothetical protein
LGLVYNNINISQNTPITTTTTSMSKARQSSGGVKRKASEVEPKQAKGKEKQPEAPAATMQLEPEKKKIKCKDGNVLEIGDISEPTVDIKDVEDLAARIYIRKVDSKFYPEPTTLNNNK